jgi:hypothetical protein
MNDQSEICTSDPANARCNMLCHASESVISTVWTTTTPAARTPIAATNVDKAIIVTRAITHRRLGLITFGEIFARRGASTAPEVDSGIPERCRHLPFASTCCRMFV